MEEVGEVEPVRCLRTTLEPVRACFPLRVVPGQLTLCFPSELYVGNLPFRVRWQDLKDLMRKCGTVLRADVALTPHDGRSRGFGVVLFARYG